MGLRQDLLTHRRNGGTPDSFEMLHAAGDLLPPRQIADSLLAEASELVEPVISVLHGAVRSQCDPRAGPRRHRARHRGTDHRKRARRSWDASRADHRRHVVS
ncbi:MAG: hypothetical protein M5U19_21655 [Microthrixaceae bacterium]|nr:hypothetical protein [Microthrixaceae bacterium]